MKSKKLFALLLTLCMVLSCVPVTALATESSVPEQEADGVYQIGNAEQLYWFAELVNGTLEGVEQNASANAVLTADIVVNTNVLNENYELNDGDFRAWTPIADYKGKFDGQGHTISGIYFNDAEQTRGGLFANITGSASSISNLNLTDSYVCGSNDTGGIVGYLSSGKVTNCTFSGAVIGTTYVGGIVGYAISGEIANCTNSGTVTASNAAVGGIVGCISGVPVSGCSNIGTVSGISKVGGVVGSNYACTISDCTNSGSITGEKLAGGICGYGERTGSTNARYPKIENCSNSGNITITTSYAGGIAGDNGGSVTGCSNTGSITGSGMVGGIAGASSSVYDSCNSGAVTGNSSVGGIVGCGSGGFAKVCYVFRSWNTASVRGTARVGGIGGGIVEAEDCYNQGSVTGGEEFYNPDTSVGGIVGYGDAENCYNIGNLIINGIAPKIGSIIGEVYNANYVSNNYYLVGTAPYGVENKDTAGKAEPKTLQDFVRGEVCYLLQSATSEQLWGQNLDNGQPVQEYPVFSDALVYEAAAKYCNGEDVTDEDFVGAYSNTENNTVTVHSYRSGICTRCGAEDPDFVAGVTRLAGANRYETAVMVADQMKETLGVEKFDAIILANGYNFADALSGSYLAAVKDAPILLTWNGSEKYNYLNEYTVDYVKANLNEDGTVYILGGTSAVPETVDAMLEGYNIVRMDGANRFETNIMILKEAGVNDGDEILVCTSTNFADSLSGSAAGLPILLVWNEGGKLFDVQSEYLAGISGKNTFCILGGENAVSAKMAEIFEGYGETIRLAGSNRFETSVLVAEKYFPDAETAVLAYAWDFPDGLCGGSLAYAMDAPLILTMTKYEAKAAEYIQGQGIRAGIVLGGTGLISDESVRSVFAMDAEAEIIVK